MFAILFDDTPISVHRNKGSAIDSLPKFFSNRHSIAEIDFGGEDAQIVYFKDGVWSVEPMPDSLCFQVESTEPFEEGHVFRVYLKPSEKQNGSFVCRINAHPELDGKEKPGKYFFPKGDWASEGWADVVICEEHRNIGYIEGEMLPLFLPEEKKIVEFLCAHIQKAAGKTIRFYQSASGAWFGIQSENCPQKNYAFTIGDEMLVWEQAYGGPIRELDLQTFMLETRYGEDISNQIVSMPDEIYEHWDSLHLETIQPPEQCASILDVAMGQGIVHGFRTSHGKVYEMSDEATSLCRYPIDYLALLSCAVSEQNNQVLERLTG